MKVRMKRKHLLYGIISFFIISIMVVVLVVPALKEYKVERMIANGDPNAGQAIIELIDSANTTSRKIRLIEDFVLSSMSRSEHAVYIGPNLTSRIDSPWIEFDSKQRENIMIYYFTHSSPNNNWRYIEALDQYASIISEEKGIDEAIAFVKQKNEELYPNGYDVYSEPWTLKLPELYLKQGDFHKAKEELVAIHEYEKRRVKEKDFKYNPSWQWMTYMLRILAKEGELDEAYDLIDHWVKDEREQRIEYFGENEMEFVEWIDHTVMEWKSIISQASVGNGNEKGVLTGLIKREDGTPMQGVYVYLHDASSQTKHIPVPETDNHAITDDKGEFVFENINTGSYQIGLGLELYHIDGYNLSYDQRQVVFVNPDQEADVTIEFTKIIDLFHPVNGEAIDKEEMNFQWEQVGGADYYHIYLGVKHDGVVMNFFYDDVKTNNVVIGKEEWKERLITSITVEDDTYYPDLDYYKKLISGDVEFSWSVSAYQDDGSHLSSSHGYRLSKETIGNLPTFSFELEKTKADELFLKGKLKGAYELYKADYAADNNNVYALAMQTMLTPHVVDGNVGSEMYGAALKELALTTKEPHTYMNVLDYLRRQEDLDGYKEWFHLYEELLTKKNQSVDMYEANRYAKILFCLGDMDEARKWFHYLDKDTLSHYYVGDVLAFELYNGIDKQNVMEIAKTYKENYGEHKDWESLLESITYDADMKHFIEVYFGQGWEQAEELLPTITSKHNKAFLRQIIE
ncbi:carboxypeptidase-like regulatory domain-containing protein [Alkalihalobacillus sp. LMS39]|uniref:carboxypeptidase-like regulatory domain-containing protein n=1 Tax=Alkalihalobacillus sp. LMS39 TaxID=2924032 RepID=UPI001FB52FC5|nr:carboxypeptidase-like regulatory domain-containing protein [Alkalihalobacillus sp. LMS39]UOE93781.1 carboxypeptidase-like regulatory domain-containing protein [Alkalihalobacillus sp. LMS39]